MDPTRGGRRRKGQAAGERGFESGAHHFAHQRRRGVVAAARAPIFGIHDALEHAEVEAQVVGVFELPKGSEQIDQGDPVFWDDGNGIITGVTGAGLFPVGVATEGAATGAPSVRVRLSGIPVEAVPGT